MQLWNCKECDTCFNAIKCPECGWTAPPMGCLLILLPVVAGLSLLAWCISNEVVPRQATHQSGNVTYVFRSMQEAVLAPAGVVLLLLSVLANAIVFRRTPLQAAQDPEETGGGGLLYYLFRTVLAVVQFALGGALHLLLCAIDRTLNRKQPLPPEQQPERPRVWRPLATIGRNIKWIVAVLVLVVLFPVVFIHLVYVPLSEFRQVEVTDVNLVCETLYRTREIPLADIISVRLERETQPIFKTEYLALQIAIETQAQVFKSVRVSLEVDERNIPRFERLMAECVKEIDERRQTLRRRRDQR